MASINQVILMGNMVAKPELRQSQGGTAYTSFRMGVQRDYKNSEGKYDSDFINVKAMGKTAEMLCTYFDKGSSVIVFGSIQTGSYKKQDGTTVYTTDIMADKIRFGEKRERPAEAQNVQQYAQTTAQIANNTATNQYDSASLDELGTEDDLPF